MADKSDDIEQALVSEIEKEKANVVQSQDKLQHLEETLRFYRSRNDRLVEEVYQLLPADRDVVAGSIGDILRERGREITNNRVGVELRRLVDMSRAVKTTRGQFRRKEPK